MDKQKKHKRHSRQVAELPGPEASADYVQEVTPRLVKVAAITAISFALYDGANRVLLDSQWSREDARQIVAGYREGTISITAVRLMVLLDADPNVVSFQTVYSRLNRAEVVDELVRRARHRSPWAEALEDQVEANIRASVREFLDTYKAINWHDLHGRLQHFRNHGLAHLLPQPIKKRVTYAEVGSLVRSVTTMGECLASFDPDGVLLRVDEITDWSDRAKSMWETMFRALKGPR
jgi:hypothetical protein